MKHSIENELMLSMQRKLANSEETESGIGSLEKAVDYVNSAIDILDSEGMQTSANDLLNMLLKIAQKHHKQQKPRDPRGIKDRHHPKSADEMVKNLLDHGTLFNLSDDGVLNADDPDLLEVTEDDSTFEDE